MKRSNLVQRRVGAVSAGIIGTAVLAGAIAVAAPVGGQTKGTDEPRATEEASLSLSCEESRALDNRARQQAETHGMQVPGPEQYPPVRPQFNPNEPPREAPIDPDTGQPKGSGSPDLPERPDYDGAAEQSDLMERPCGKIVDRVRESAQETGGIVCFLADGRYGSVVMVDAVGEVNANDLCRHLGFSYGEN